MTKLTLLAFILFLAGTRLSAGTITGTVRAEGKTASSSGDDSGGAYANRKYKFAEKVDYSAMHDFIVYVDGLSVTNLAATNLIQVTTAKVAQRGAVFLPHVQPVMVGTRVEWPNNDDIYHNVFSMSDAKQFDLDLYKGNPPGKNVVFDKVGRVDVYCSIHANMHCVVLVLPNPYFATTDADGRFTITNVPPGTYNLKAWQERLPADQTEVVVPTNGEAHVDFVLGIKNLPKY
jgi:plastocyanin